jgi:hypothetical protein
MPKMTDDELRAIIAAEIAHCDTHSSTDADDRALALKYYLCDPDAGVLANRGEGRSSVVSSDVRDTIEWAMPSLMRIFAAADKVVEFEPVGAEDIAAAAQETAVVNHIVLKSNRGFEVLYAMFKDALLSKRGTVKVTWETTKHKERETYENLTPDEYQGLISDSDVTEVDHRERKVAPQMLAGVVFPWWAPSVHDVVIERVKSRGQVKIENIPPEEFGVAQRARDDVTSPVLFHRTRKTVSELLEMGYDKDKVESLPSYQDDTGITQERQARLTASSAFDTAPDTLDDSMREVVVIEMHLLVDFDGDGVAERRKIVVGGNAADVILENEEEDDHPFATICPLPMPHRATGLSVADLASESQVTNTVILRQTLDNFYLTNNSRVELPEAAMGDNTIDDLLTVRPGGIVRTAAAGQMRPMETKSVLGDALSMIEYMNSVRENRTGITRYNQGLDANSLNKTATGVSLIQNAAMQRLELIARVFAETGLKRMFLLVHDLLRQHSEKEIPFRLRGEWIPVDPRKWARRMDMTATVGLGTGNKDQQIAQLDGLLAIQNQIVQMQGGTDGPLVTLKNVHNTLEKRVAVAEIGAPDQYFSDPERAPPQQPKPNPAMEKAQAELQIKQADAQQSAQLAQMQAQQSAQLEQQKAQAQLALEAQKARQQMQLDHQKAEHDMAMEELRIQHDIRLAELKARAEISVKQRTAEMGMAVQAAAAIRPEAPAAEVDGD